MWSKWTLGKKSRWWTPLGSWSSTVTALHLGKLSFCWNSEDLQQMEQLLALLACLCLLVFKWTCSYPETSCTVSFLLSHFCSLILRARLLLEAIHTFPAMFCLDGGFWCGAGREEGEMQREEVECDLTWVISWGAVWTEAVLLSWCQANLLWCFIVGDIGKHISYETGD